MEKPWRSPGSNLRNQKQKKKSKLSRRCVITVKDSGLFRESEFFWPQIESQTSVVRKWLFHLTTCSRAKTLLAIATEESHVVGTTNVERYFLQDGILPLVLQFFSESETRVTWKGWTFELKIILRKRKTVCRRFDKWRVSSLFFPSFTIYSFSLTVARQQKEHEPNQLDVLSEGVHHGWSVLHTSLAEVCLRCRPPWLLNSEWVVMIGLARFLHLSPQLFATRGVKLSFCMCLHCTNEAQLGSNSVHSAVGCYS